jgi:hypothetical protein
VPGPPRRVLLAAGFAALIWAWFVCRDWLGAAGDVVAILFVPIALGLVCFAAAAGIRWRPALIVAGSAAVLGLVAVVGPWTPFDAGRVAPGPGVRVAGANIGPGFAESADALRGLNADVLVVSELEEDLHAELAPGYRYGQLETDEAKVAMYSRFPYRVLERPSEDLPGLRVEVAGPSGPFVLYALHVPRPWFRRSGGAFQVTIDEHRRLIALVAARARAETLPVVVIGDLNAPDRSSDYRVLLDRGGLSDAMRDGWTGPTSLLWAPLLLRIDHIMVGGGWCADGSRQFELPESDHRGVTAVVGPCAG